MAERSSSSAKASEQRKQQRQQQQQQQQQRQRELEEKIRQLEKDLADYEIEQTAEDEAESGLLFQDVNSELPDGVVVVWEAQPQQALLISCPIEDIFFGGARGGGKTDGSLGDWISHQDLYKSAARGIFFRRTYDELEEAQARAIELFTPLGAVYKAQKRTWIFPNGATLKMRYLKRDADAANYQGHQYTWMCFEELGNWPNPAPIDKLRACLRSGRSGPDGKPIPKSFRATGNPGGVGHGWIKVRYIDPAPPLTPFYDEEGETWRVYIPSKLSDNKALTENDPDYWKRVKASANGDEALLEAWANGNWDIIAGGMFDDLFKRDIHVIEPFEIPASWTVDRSFDWGSSKPFSVHWNAQSDGTEAPNGITYPAGTLFIIEEWYGWNGKPNQGLKLLAVEVADGVVEREEVMPFKVYPGPADSAIFNIDPTSGISIADDMESRGVEWERADKSPGSRKTGWERTRKYLKACHQFPMEQPGLFVFKHCTHFIRTVPILPRSERDRDDVNTEAEDHAGDNTRYRVMWPGPKVVSYW
jgi:hypothetical protein